MKRIFLFGITVFLISGLVSSISFAQAKSPIRQTTNQKVVLQDRDGDGYSDIQDKYPLDPCRHADCNQLKDEDEQWRCTIDELFCEARSDSRATPAVKRVGFADTDGDGHIDVADRYPTDACRYLECGEMEDSLDQCVCRINENNCAYNTANPNATPLPTNLTRSQLSTIDVSSCLREASIHSVLDILDRIP